MDKNRSRKIMIMQLVVFLLFVVFTIFAAVILLLPWAVLLVRGW